MVVFIRQGKPKETVKTEYFLLPLMKSGQSWRKMIGHTVWGGDSKLLGI